MSDTLERDSLLVAYAKWHYTQGLTEFFEVVKNFLWFTANFFSFKLLLKTLFSPWKRMGEKYHGGLDFGALASTLVVNSLMRIVGFVTRTVVLCLGLVSLIVILAASAIVLAVWLLAPAILIACLTLTVIFFAV